jgi:hypothetical protein
MINKQKIIRGYFIMKFKRLLAIIISVLLFTQIISIDMFKVIQRAVSYAEKVESTEVPSISTYTTPLVTIKPTLEDTYNIIIEVDKSSANVGDTIIADIKVNNVNNFAGYQFCIKYDPEVLQPVEADSGQPFDTSTNPLSGNIIQNTTYLPVSLANNDLVKGYLSFGKAYMDMEGYRKSLPETTGVIGKIGFKVLKQNKTELKFQDPSQKKSVMIFDWFGKEINSYSVNQLLAINDQFPAKSPNASVSTNLVNNITSTNEASNAANTLSALSSTSTTPVDDGYINVEGYVVPDNAAASKSNFIIELYDRNLSNVVLTKYSDANGYFSIEDFSLKDNNIANGNYEIRIMKTGYLARVYDDGIIGEYRIGSINSPEIMYKGDLPTSDTNNDGILDYKDQDGAINMADVTCLSPSFGSVIGDPNYYEYKDINNDGAIGMSDVINLSPKFNYTSSDITKSITLINDCMILGDSTQIVSTDFDLNGNMLYVTGNLQYRTNNININCGRSI